MYPEVQRKLQEEIDDVLENKDEDQEIDADDITNMSYLDQVKQKRTNQNSSSGRIYMRMKFIDQTANFWHVLG